MSEHTSTCSVASEALPLPLSGQDSEPLLFASETNSAKPSLKSIGRRSLAKPTSASSTEPGIEALTCSQGDFLASHTVAPGSSSARQMTARSGRKCCALLKSQNPLSLLAKTLLESSTWNSTVVFLTWKPRVTPSKRLLFQLAPSMPDTDGTEFGLWPTPNTEGYRSDGELRALARMAGDEEEFYAMSKRAAQSKQLAALRFFPTPTARDHKDGGAMSCQNVPANGLLGRVIHQTTNGQSGQLNPQWVEWLMGYPPEWTALSPSEIASFRVLRIKSLKQSRKSKSNNENLH